MSVLRDGVGTVQVLTIAILRGFRSSKQVGLSRAEPDSSVSNGVSNTFRERAMLLTQETAAITLQSPHRCEQQASSFISVVEEVCVGSRIFGRGTWYKICRAGRADCSYQRLGPLDQQQVVRRELVPCFDRRRTCCCFHLSAPKNFYSDSRVTPRTLRPVVLWLTCAKPRCKETAHQRWRGPIVALSRPPPSLPPPQRSPPAPLDYRGDP